MKAAFRAIRLSILCPRWAAVAALALLGVTAVQTASGQINSEAAATAVRDSARPGVRNDLLTLYREALAQDATFASARYQQQAVQERTPQALSQLLPNLGLVGTASQNLYDQSVYVEGTPTFKEHYWNVTGGLQLVIPAYRPQNWQAYEQAKLAVLQGDATLQSARQDLLVRVATAYFNVLAARDQLIALEASKNATLEQLSQAKREFEVGTKTIIDTNEAQARYDQIEAQEQVALGTLVIRKSELQTIIGRNVEAVSELRDRPVLTVPQPTDINEWVRAAEGNNFQVQIYRAGYEIASREVQRAHDAYKPTVDIVAGYNYNRSSAAPSFDYPSSIRSNNIGLQFNMPLYSGGLIQSRVREALALQDRSGADLEAARRAAANSARGAFTGVNYGLSQVQALESAERSAQTQLDSTQLGYQVGVRIQLDVLNATTLLFQTQRDLKQARYNFLLSGLQLKAATGSLLEEDVQAVNALLVQ